MAWPLGGAWDGATVADLPAIIAALCRGVNERREACALVTVDFLYGDGTVEKAYPSAADYDGFPVSQLGDLVVQLEDQITALAESGYYSVAFQNNTVYTDIADVLAVNGDDPFTGGAGEQHDATIWLRMKRCLDVLVFGRFEEAMPTYVGDDSGRTSVDVGTYTSLAAAWAAMLTDTPGAADPDYAAVVARRTYNDPNWTAQLQELSISHPLPAYLGTNWKIVVNATISATYTASAYTMTANGVDKTISANNTGTPNATNVSFATAEDDDGAFPETLEITVTGSESNPFSSDTASVAATVFLIGQSTPDAVCYLDQTTILTDQA